MMSMAALIVASGDEFEDMLIAHFVERCHACREAQPRSWPMMCLAHAPVVRAFLEPAYLAELRTTIPNLEREIETFGIAIGANERIATGELWKRDHMDRAAEAHQRLTALHESIPERLRGVPLLELRGRRRDAQRTLTHYREILKRVEDASQVIKKTVAGADQEGQSDGGVRDADAQGDGSPAAA